MTTRLQRWATGRNVLLLLALDFIFMLGILPASQRKMESLTGSAFSPIDLCMPSWNKADAMRILGPLGDAGRNLYQTIELTADVVYPLIYGFAFALAITFLLGRINKNPGGLRYLAFLPLAGMFFDWIENGVIVAAIRSFPNIPEGVATIGGLATMAKWGLVLPGMLVTVLGFLIWIIMLVRKK
jgi:hypothetical protein